MKRLVTLTVTAISTATVILALLIGWIVPSIVPPGDVTVPPPADPGTLGPYQVGVVRRKLARPASQLATPQPIASLTQPLDVVIWYPARLGTPAPAIDEILAAPLEAVADRGGAPYPVVLFAHGSGGGPWISTYFTTHLASHGFIVLAVAHIGSRTDRPAELISVLDQVSRQNPTDDGLLTGLIDGARVGVTGFSLGGDSALRVAATDQRTRAVIAMAPSGSGTGPPPLVDAVSDVAAPAMLMWGVLDEIVPHDNHRPLLDRLGQAAPERWLITLRRTGHFAFADRCLVRRRGCGPNDLPQARAHALINRWATAFLLRHVAGDERYAAYLDPAQAADDPDLLVTFAPPGDTARRTP